MDAEFSLELILHEEVQRLLDNFAAVVRAHVVFYNAAGGVLRRGRGEGNCRFCQLVQKRFSVDACVKLDREKQRLARESGQCQSYFCHAGLREAVMPVMTGGELLGYIVFGQCRGTENLSREFVEQFPRKTRGELRRAFKSLPYLNSDGMGHLTGLMQLLVDYLVRRELVTRGGNWLCRATVRCIEENLTRRLTLTEVARRLGRSVSGLSHCLKDNAETSFKKILIEKRLTHAEKLLKEHPEMTVKEAADRSGFADPYYFSRLYRKYRHCTPGEFRKRGGFSVKTAAATGKTADG